MSDDNQKHYPWQDGIPTKPDVDSLMKAFPPESIKPGEWRASDEEIRKHIGKSDGVRYRTVYSAWIARLSRDHAVIVYREKTSGFYCPTAAEVFSRTHPTLEQAGRKIGKQLRGVSHAKPTNDVERVTQDHQGKLLYVQKRELKKARMNLLPQTVAAEMPRIEAPKEAESVGDGHRRSASNVQ